jgi:hypothetical protein
MRLAASRLRDHLAGHEQSELDADAGEADSLSARLRAGRDIVIPRQLAPLHPPAVVRHRERRLGGVGRDTDAGGAGVEGVGDHFREDRLLEGAAVGVPEILEQVPQVDPCLAHGRILSPGKAERTSSDQFLLAQTKKSRVHREHA